CLIPIRLRQQEHPHIGPQTAADISEGEVQPIEPAEVPDRNLNAAGLSRASRNGQLSLRQSRGLRHHGVISFFLATMISLIALMDHPFRSEGIWKAAKRQSRW